MALKHLLECQILILFFGDRYYGIDYYGYFWASGVAIRYKD